MASFGEFFGGTGSNYLVRRVKYVSASESFVAPTRGKLIILAVAPGGSGAAVSSAVSGPAVALGGWAGEVAADFVNVEAGDTYTVLMGSPGAAVSVTGSSANGNNAGDTLVTGPNGYSLTVKGGSGGVFALASGTLTNGSGAGAGTGGSANVMRGRGGRGGQATNTPATASTANRKATGGGAVNMLFTTSTTDTRGGDANQSAVGGAASLTGGGGCGGRGGDATSVNINTCGGGYGGPAVDNTAASTAIGPNAAGQAVATSPLYLVPGLASFGLDFFGGGGFSTAVNAGPGGGSGCTASANAGIFGGSGANLGASASNPGMGGGSGASITSSAATTASTSAGGASFVTFVHLQEVV